MRVRVVIVGIVGVVEVPFLYSSGQGEWEVGYPYGLLPSGCVRLLVGGGGG